MSSCACFVRRRQAPPFALLFWSGPTLDVLAKLRLNSDKSFAQFVRYALVGGFNTVFGYGLFALLNWSFTGLVKYGYIFASVLASTISITAAFLGYKWFVFRTRGNYLIEWMRCVGVYGSSIAIGIVGLPILVPILRSHLQRPERAPYIAAAITTVITVIFGFLGHKNISFREKLSRASDANPHAEPPAKAG
jgi:putative flippase GtrA